MRDTTTSNAPSGSASASASAGRTSTWGSPARRHAVPRSRSSPRRRRSARPRPPRTSVAATRPTPPGPQATSSTRSPGRRGGPPEQHLGHGRALLVDARGVAIPPRRGRGPLRALHGPKLVGVHGADATRARASLAGVRILALADAPPRRPVPELVAAGRPDLVVLLGDLEPAWVDGLAELDVPRLGIHGNHDDPGSLAALGAEDVHLRRVDVDGLSFSRPLGVAASAARAASSGPRTRRPGSWAVCPPPTCCSPTPRPRASTTSPATPCTPGGPRCAHGSQGTSPAWLLHGHTGVPLPPARPVHRLGPTRVVHVRGSALIDLPPSG